VEVLIAVFFVVVYIVDVKAILLGFPSTLVGVWGIGASEKDHGRVRRDEE